MKGSVRGSYDVLSLTVLCGAGRRVRRGRAPIQMSVRSSNSCLLVRNLRPALTPGARFIARGMRQKRSNRGFAGDGLRTNNDRRSFTAPVSTVADCQRRTSASMQETEQPDTLLPKSEFCTWMSWVKRGRDYLRVRRLGARHRRAIHGPNVCFGPGRVSRSFTDGVRAELAVSVWAWLTTITVGHFGTERAYGLLFCRRG